jgi:hypothetical protein
METKVEALQEVEKRLKQEKGRRMFERYQTVRLHLYGQDPSQIATAIGKSEYTIKEYNVLQKKRMENSNVNRQL